MNNIKLVLGGPGCGKTSRLLEIVESELNSGISSHRIAFVSFTKKATTEAQDRAAQKFSLDIKEGLPWFRTIHSLTYSKMGVQRDEVMGPRDWKEFADYSGYPVNGGGFADGAIVMAGARSAGESMLRTIEYAAATMVPIEEAWQELGGEAGDWWTLKQFHLMYLKFKDYVGKMDFADMLQSYANNGESVDVDVAIIDEAQDLTALQWQVVRKAFANAKRVYIAGDDDQAIYRWAGADVDQFLSFKEAEREVLSISHRLPKSVAELSYRVVQRISNRYTKEFRSREEQGKIEWHMEPDNIDVSSGSWYLLARHNYQLPELEDNVRRMGYNYVTHKGAAVKPEEYAMMVLWERLRSGKTKTVSAKEARSLMKLMERPIPLLKELKLYTPAELGITHMPIWHEALVGIPYDRREFYISCLRSGEKLGNAPRIRIDTIHGVKGGEADKVLLLTDVSSRAERGFQIAPDNEHRVFYVGITRARQELHIVAPRSSMYYPI